MPFDWEELKAERVENLEKRKLKLEKEIQAMQKPDVNRMVAEKLGTTIQGCNCQRMLLVLVQNGEVKSYQALTPTPCHLVEVRAEKGNYNSPWLEADKVGEAFYDKKSYGFFSIESAIGFERHPQLMQTIQINGKHYHQNPCSYSDEMTGDELLSEYSCPDEIKALPNGIYQILWENACYTYSTMEGTEGDGDTDFKIYDSIPLYEFMEHKESLLAEAESEAEELAERYLYIQETKQRRKKKPEVNMRKEPSGPTMISSMDQMQSMFGALTRPARNDMPDMDLDIINPFDTMDAMESMDRDKN